MDTNEVVGALQAQNAADRRGMDRVAFPSGSVIATWAEEGRDKTTMVGNLVNASPRGCGGVFGYAPEPGTPVSLTIEMGSPGGPLISRIEVEEARVARRSLELGLPTRLMVGFEIDRANAGAAEAIDCATNTLNLLQIFSTK